MPTPQTARFQHHSAMSDQCNGQKNAMSGPPEAITRMASGNHGDERGEHDGIGRSMLA